MNLLKSKLCKKSIFNLRRPFENQIEFSTECLIDIAEESLNEGLIEIPSLIRPEFSYRKNRSGSKKLRELFVKHNKRPIFWLQAAREELLKIKLEKRGKHHVYTILLEYPGNRYPFGIYIGESSRTPENRFKKHKAGKKASRHVKNRGKEILYSTFQHLCFPERKYAKSLEERMADCLRIKKMDNKGLPSYRIKGGH